MGSSSSRNVEASNSSSPGRQRYRRERGHHQHDTCFFGRRHHHNSEIKGRNSEASSSSVAQEQDKYLPESRSGTSEGEYKRITGGIILETTSQGGTSTTAEISLLPSDCQSPSTSSSDDDETKVMSSDSSDDDDNDEEQKICDEEHIERSLGGPVVEVSSRAAGSSSSGPLQSLVNNNNREVNAGGLDEVTEVVHGVGLTSSSTTTTTSSYTDRQEEQTTTSSLRMGESRRNSGRRFWDALTRAASHRRNSTPITIVAIEEIDDNGSSTSRWNFQHWRASMDAEQSSASRISDLEDRRRHVRSHVWALQRLSGGLQVSRAHDRSCPASGNNTSDGFCSCEAGSNSEDSSTRASISRIIMLAEALFEVLDEIHRQSVALSRSATMSLSSLPAPDEIVDSIPIRLFKNSDVFLEEAAQCHICLIEYEEDDEIRVLPCQHEYHKGCVDKWLKEVHRVCPLCRGDVCGSEDPTIEVPSS